MEKGKIVMESSSLQILLVVAVYLIGMLYIGFKCVKESSGSASDFFLGGRKLGPFVTAMSAEASDMSSYLLMGLPGLAYLSGVADVGWTAIGLAVGTYLNWLFTAKRLRRYTEITESFTFPQFLSDRFHDDKHILQAIAAVIIIIFFIPYTGSGFAACGKLFNSLFGINYMTAMVVSAIVIVGYTTAGGFLAASFTDFIQSIVMTCAICFALFYAVDKAGSWSAVMDNARSLPGYLDFGSRYIEETGTSGTYSLLTIFSTLAWGLGYFGMPHILLRFMAIEDENKLALSRRVASVWVVIAMAVAVLIGIVGKSLSMSGLLEELHGSATETVIVRIADFMANMGTIPTIAAGLIISGILASTMSTADSQLLAASSSVSTDLLGDFLHIQLTHKQSMLIARLSVIAIAVVGVFIANDPDSSVFGIVSFAWAGFGAGFGPLVICSLYWKRTTLQGAMAGMLVGGVMIFIWKYLVRPLGGIWDVYELLPAFVLSLIAIIAVSLMTPEPSKEIEEEFELHRSDKQLTRR